MSIERRFKAMEAFHRAGMCTACFISPIFPGITHVETIILRAKGICNVIWLKNLNLRGSYRSIILDYIRKKYPQLLALHQEIYQHGNYSCWTAMDKRLRGSLSVYILLSTGFVIIPDADE